MGKKTPVYFLIGTTMGGNFELVDDELFLSEEEALTRLKEIVDCRYSDGSNIETVYIVKETRSFDIEEETKVYLSENK